MNAHAEKLRSTRRKIDRQEITLAELRELRDSQMADAVADEDPARRLTERQVAQESGVSHAFVHKRIDATRKARQAA